MSPEAELVISLCRFPLSPAAKLRAEKLIQGRPDWRVCLEAAAEWEVEPVVFTNLLSLDNDAVPPEITADVIARNRAERARWVLMTQVLLDLLQALDGAGIPVIVIKGPAISLAAYGDVSLRPFRDFDLLVHRRDLERARNLLLARGYAPEYETGLEEWLTKEQLPLEFSDGRTQVDLHWTLLSRNWRLDFDLHEIWAEARTIACLDSSITVLSPAHLFVFLCAHGAKHRWSSLRWICDLAQLQDRLTAAEIDRVLDIAVAARAQRMLALGVRVVRELFRDEGSLLEQRLISPDHETRKLVEEVRNDWMTGSGPAQRSVVSRLHPALSLVLFWAGARESRWDGIASIWRFAVFPSARDATAGRAQWLWRPLRLASAAMRRVAGSR